MREFARILGITPQSARLWCRKRGVSVQPNGKHLYVSMDKLRDAFPEVYGDVAAALEEREAMAADEDLLCGRNSYLAG